MEADRISHLPRTQVVIEGEIALQLCGDFGALVEAEAHYGINLADVLFTWGKDTQSLLNGARSLLPCALRTFHPSLGYDDAQAIIDRALAADDPAIFNALWNMLPPKTERTEAANRTLRSDLASLAGAIEVFEGKSGVALGFNLGHVWRVLWPCVVRRSRPELSLDEARSLMTLEGMRLVIGLLGVLVEAASQEERETFVRLVRAVASDDGELEFLFWAIAKQPWPDVAQA